MTDNTVTATELVANLKADLADDQPAFVWGSPGIGKSDLVRQVAREMDLPLIDLRANLLDPVDLRGLPTVSADKTSAIWLPMGELPDAERDGKEGILFVDELAQAQMAVQTSFFGLVLDRVCGAYRLPDGWKILAASNLMSDRAGAQRMPSALANRFAHYNLGVDVDSWCRWALETGISPELVAFIRFRPELLQNFEPDRLINATPRSWATCDKVIKAGHAPALEMHRLTARVGDPAIELIAFLKIWRTLPSPDGVLLDPDNSPVPTDGATLFALCGALARKVTAQTMDSLITYLGRINEGRSPEFGVMAIKDAVARDHTLTATNGFIAWSSANSDIYL